MKKWRSDRIERITGVLLALMWMGIGAGAQEKQIPDYDPDWKPTRDLTRFFAKLRAGESVTVVAIGGSVTTRPSWADVAVEWLRGQFPSNEIIYQNVAEGGTGPSQTIWKFRRAVVPAEPDLMFIEYAVNCYGKPEDNYKPLDGMVQQLLRMPNPADIAFVYVGNKDWKPSTGWESVNVQPAGRHYGFPEVHARAYLQTKLDAGEVKWDDLARDGIHPRQHNYNDPKHSAHALYGEAVIAMLKEQMARTGEPTPLPPVPAPFYSEAWVTADMLPVSAAKREGAWQTKPAQGSGRAYFEDFLESNETGASLTITAHTTSFVIFTYPAFDGGTITWSIDGGPERSYWVGKGAEKNFLTRVWSVEAADNLAPGEHTLTVKVGPQKEGTTGNYIRVGGFGVAPPPGQKTGGSR